MNSTQTNPTHRPMNSTQTNPTHHPMNSTQTNPTHHTMNSTDTQTNLINISLNTLINLTIIILKQI